MKNRGALLSVPRFLRFALLNFLVDKWEFVVSTPRAQRAEFGAPVEGRYKIDRGGAALAAEPRVIHPSIGTPEGWHKGWYYIAGLSLSAFYQ